MNSINQIAEGKVVLGIEFGSTRIKAVLIGEDLSPLAHGTHDWKSKLEKGVWTYALEEVWQGVRDSVADLLENVREQYGIALGGVASIGVSAMMHGYLVFDANDTLLVPFRTWQNTMTAEASETLTHAFSFHIPQRWSIAHLYQAILNGEPHVSELRSLTTLAGYVHWQLTGARVVGIGDASGIFPIDTATASYHAGMLQTFAALTADTSFSSDLSEVLPAIVPVGECAGRLTEHGALLLDPTGIIRPGTPFCPPEGDAQTGMVATNSIAPKTGNVSAGTSIFAMTVLEHDLSAVHEEIDMVVTPCGFPVAMVHCNNCTNELDAWVSLFKDVLKTFGLYVPKRELYDKLYKAALSGNANCDGILTYNYQTGEHVTGFASGKPLLMRSPTAGFTIANLMRSMIYSCMATLKIGMDILQNEEKITLKKIYAHGGLFKAPVTGQRFLASALGVPVALMESAGEGGAWGIALLAAYQARDDRQEPLDKFLDSRVFADKAVRCVQPNKSDQKGFSEYMEAFRAGLAVEQAAVSLGS